jgi:CheY-like chemotaxis protein
MATIMLVEDALDTRDLVKTILEMEGHTVESAETGEEAITLIRAAKPDVILMDISLPGNISGLDVVKKLRADSDFDAIPILALTAHAMTDDASRSLAAGCDEHITKPIFDLEEFAGIVSAYAANGRNHAKIQDLEFKIQD